MTDTSRAHPLPEADTPDRVPDPSLMVIFGASGDLTGRKLMPALFDLMRGGALPDGFAILGAARTPMSDDAFRAHVLEGMKEHGQLGAGEEPLWNAFAAKLFYLPMDPARGEEYARLAARIGELSAACGSGSNRLFYLSTPPNLYTPIVRHLGAAGIARPPSEGWSRIIIEKPFGTDLASARALNAEVLRVFREEQVYRIDHYLGKETVQNLLVFRFANGIFEPVWNRNYVDHVQITAAETVGVEGRGGYYEQAGAMRDMVQNHMLQLLALTAMEPPVQFDARQVRDEKQKVFDAISPIGPEHVHRCTVRGQYAAGMMDGKHVPGYREEAGVAPGSTTETYVAIRFAVENWRWAGVPFFVRSGKRLPKRVTEIAVRFRRTPHHLFRATPVGGQDRNSIVIRIQPDEGISLRFSAKVPGPGMEMRPVTMDFKYGSSFHGRLADAYTRLLLDAMLGDATLYARGDSVEVAWSLITPIHEGWAGNSASLVHPYPAGTWGPVEAEALLEGEARRWRIP